MKNIALISLFLFLPTFIFAADFSDFVNSIIEFNNLLIVLIFALTFLTITWGIVSAWILHPGEEREIERGKNIAIVGIIALVIMVTFWGILNLLREGFFPG